MRGKDITWDINETKKVLESGVRKKLRERNI